MDGQLWLNVVDIFHAAVERPEEERAEFVIAACDGSEEIRTQVLAMLDEDRRGVSWLRDGVAAAVDRAFEDMRHSLPFVPPERIGLYERQEFLGRGGMGAVWKALRIDTGQPMAIKFLLPRDRLSEMWRRRFADEISTLARLRHPYIVSFHDAGVLDDETPFFVMDYVEEYVRGMRFTAYSRLPGRSIDERLRLFRSVCEAVLYAHLQGVIHRDLKPSNILIAKDGTPRIVDFGIARRLQDAGEAADATSPSLRVMSLDYAAPEWKYEGQVGVCTDVYSLGVILYEVLAGRHPFRQQTQPQGFTPGEKSDRLPEKPSAIVLRERSADSQPGLSRWAWRDLDKLCLTAMHPDVRQRYASVESLIRDIDHYLNSEPLDAQPRMLRYRMGKFVRRRRRAVLASAATLLLVLSMAALFTWRLARERNVAVAEAARVLYIQNFMNNLLQGGDQDAGPEANLPVTAMLDRGMQQAAALRGEPLIQSDIYQTLGTISQKLGRLSQAESLLQKALSDRESLKDQDPAGIAATQIALGLVYADEEKTQAAEQLVRRSLDELRSRAPGDASLQGEAELALGTVMVTAGEQSQALGELAQAVKTIEAADGPQSPVLARALGKLADAQIYAGDYDAADAFNRRALAIDRAVYGETYPHVAEDLGNLAQTQETRGYYAQAEQLEREALAIMEKWYGPDHPETARKLTTLASTLIYEKKNDEADNLLRRALAIQQRVYGPQHPHVAYVLNSMGAVALGEKKFSEAEKDNLRVAEIYRQSYGDGDYRVGVALGNLASVYQAEKRYPECERMLLDVVDRFTRALGAGNIQTGMAQVRLGRTLLYEKKYTAAAKYSLAGYESLSKQMNPGSGWVQGARHDLVIDYAELREPDREKQFEAVSAAPHIQAAR
ncbi:serine/threonine-protein kinase [Paracidobacterium acidisoli]|uniref:Protein kinase domain-containing protein n=1 Tax=Paracidobacterium acidisoli TaxID=2303751 RepID=A0A372IJY8_9BACT|nr:serine/threonine-protein kinase [Paracidobacterium acidisoli]MBT9332642.1 serine/threonine-protein kinase [Paracidobacterium acidisoli]